jgi:hypothetical protein
VLHSQIAQIQKFSVFELVRHVHSYGDATAGSARSCLQHTGVLEVVLRTPVVFGRHRSERQWL